VITALGSPREVVERVHGYGGLVFADVIDIRFAAKAIDAGVDGLVLVAAGAGGHTGQQSGFAFVEEVRRHFDGLLVLGGGISSGRGVRAARGARRRLCLHGHALHRQRGEHGGAGLQADGRGCPGRISSAPTR
jgi:hypothetical protein